MKISIITAVLNRKNEIEETLESLKNQTYRNIQHIIIDGGSTDGTLDILKNYKSTVKDYEIILMSEKDKGLYNALNKGVSLATGEIIGILHAGDLFAHNKVLEKVVNSFKEKNFIDGVYGDVEFFNESGKTVRISKLGDFDYKKILIGWHPTHPTLFLRKYVYDNLGFYREDFDIASDYEFILRVILKGKYKLFYLNEILVKMRTGGKSGQSPRKFIKKFIEDWKIVKEYNLPFYTVLLKKLIKISEILRVFKI